MEKCLFIRKADSTDSFGGLQKFFLDLVNRIDFDAAKVTVALTESRNTIFSQKLRQASLPLEMLSFDNQPQRGLKRFRYMYQFFKSACAEKIIYVEGGFYDFSLAEVIAGFVASKGNIYMIETLAPPLLLKARPYFGVIPRLRLWWYYDNFWYLLRVVFCKKIITLAFEVKKLLTKDYHYPSYKCAVSYLGVDTELFKPDQGASETIRQRLGLTKDAMIVVSIARLASIKRLDRLINAFAASFTGQDNSYLLIIGTGPLRQELESLAAKKSCASRIIFLGFQEHVSDFYKAGDIYVLSSDNEGFGVALVEAMSSGLLVIATKTPGPAEIVEDGVNGFLCDKNEASLTDVLKKALSFPKETRQIIKDAARQTVLENFEIKSRLNKLLYECEINGRK